MFSKIPGESTGWTIILILFLCSFQAENNKDSNKTSMAHPMHLHGHVFQVVEIDGDSFDGALRDALSSCESVQFDANNPGVWVGIFTVIQYKDYKPPYFSKQSILDYSRIYGGH